jgi:hypothetical protein
MVELAMTLLINAGFIWINGPEEVAQHFRKQAGIQVGMTVPDI